MRKSNKHLPRNRAMNKKGAFHKHQPAGSKLAKAVAKKSEVK